MIRAKYYAFPENYWYQVHQSEAKGVAVPWQDDYLGVMKSISGRYWVSFPEGLCPRLTHRLKGRTFESVERAIVAAKVVARLSCGMGYRLHVVRFANHAGHKTEL